MRLSLLVSTLLPLGSLAVLPKRAIIAWSSINDDSLRSADLSSKEIGDNLFDILGGVSLCEYEAVVVAHQPGLDIQDLYSLPPSSSLSRRFHSSPSNVFTSYTPSEGFRPTDAAFQLAQLCGALVVSLDGADRVNGTFDKSLKHVISIDLPAQLGDRRGRKYSMIESASALSDQLSDISSIFPSHFVVLLGSHPFSHTKREDAAAPSELPSEFFGPFTPTKQVLAVSASGSILTRYQLLTPGLITALLIAFLVLLPILFVGIYALASIQAPVRMTVSKAPTLTKKNQ